MAFTEWLLDQVNVDETQIKAWWERRALRPDGDDSGDRALYERALADCEAKRRIIDLHPRCDRHDRPGDECDACQRCGDGSVWPCDTLLAVATSYADRPEYDEASRP